MINDLKDVADKGFKSRVGAQTDDMRDRMMVKQGWVLRKSEIDKVGGAVTGFFAEKRYKGGVIRYTVYLPHNIVARKKSLENVFQAGLALGLDTVVRVRHVQET